MLQTLQEALWSFREILWGFPLIALLVVSGGYFTLRTGFFQIHPLRLCKNTVGGLLKRKEGRWDLLASVSTAIGGTVGVGSITGVAYGIAVGGAGSAQAERGTLCGAGKNPADCVGSEGAGMRNAAGEHRAADAFRGRPRRRDPRGCGAQGCRFTGKGTPPCRRGVRPHRRRDPHEVRCDRAGGGCVHQTHRQSFRRSAPDGECD